MAIKDFQGKQIRLQRLITSGGFGSDTNLSAAEQARLSGLGLLIYSSSVAFGSGKPSFTGDVTPSRVEPDWTGQAPQGNNPSTEEPYASNLSAMLQDVGSDVYMFISGSGTHTGDAASLRKDVMLYGGDLVVSGTLWAERVVVEVKDEQAGDLHLSGALEIMPDSAALEKEEQLWVRDFSGNSIFVVDAKNDLVGVGLQHPDTLLHLEGNDNTSNQLKIAASTSVNLVTIGVMGTTTGNHKAGDLVITNRDNEILKYSRENTALQVTGSIIDIGWDPNTAGTTDGVVLRLSNHHSSIASPNKLGAIEFWGGDTSTDSAGVGAKVVGEAAGLWSSGAGDNPTELQFWTSDNDTSVVQRMVITRDGKVGMGTTAPDKPLEINAGGSAANGLRLTYNDSDGSASVYADLSVGENGELTIFPSNQRIGVNKQGPLATLDLEGSGSPTTLLIGSYDGVTSGSIAWRKGTGRTGPALVYAQDASFTLVHSGANSQTVFKGNSDSTGVLGAELFVTGAIFRYFQPGTPAQTAQPGSQVLILSSAHAGKEEGVRSHDPTTARDTNFWVSGSIGNKNSPTHRGTAVFGGDLHVSGNMSYDGGMEPTDGIMEVTASILDVGWDPNNPTTETDGATVRISNHHDSIASGDDIGNIEFWGGDTSGGSGAGVGARIRAEATDNWGASGYNPTEIQFWTNDSPGDATQRMVIKDTGQIGIGTTGPNRALEINHVTGRVARLTYNDSNGSASTYVDLEVSAAGSMVIKPTGRMEVSASMLDIGWEAGAGGDPYPSLRLTSHQAAIADGDTVGVVEFAGVDSGMGGQGAGASIRGVANGNYNTGGNRPTDLILATNNGSTSQDIITVKSGGTVGVGISDPESKLHVSSAGESQLTVGRTSSDYIQIGSTDDGDLVIKATTNDTPVDIIRYDRSEASLQITGSILDIGKIASPGAGVGPVVRMTLDEAVIATNESIGKVEWAAKESGLSEPGIAAHIEVKADGEWSASSYPTKMIFSTTEAGDTEPAHAITITGEANVGMGTTTPDAELEVAIEDADTESGTILITAHALRSGSVAFRKGETTGTSAAVVLDGDEHFVLVNSGSNKDILFRANDAGDIYDAIYIDGSERRVGVGVPHGQTMDSLFVVSGSSWGTARIKTSQQKAQRAMLTLDADVRDGHLGQTSHGEGHLYAVTGSTAASLVDFVDNRVDGTRSAIVLHGVRQVGNTAERTTMPIHIGYTTTNNRPRPAVSIVSGSGRSQDKNNAHGPQVLILSGAGINGETASDPQTWSDVNFFVSGSAGAKDGNSRAVSVFGGDVVISGSLYGGSPISFGSGAEISGSFYFKKQTVGYNSQASNEIAVYARDLGAGGGLKLYQNIGGTEKVLGGAVKVSSGSTTYQDVERIDLGELGILGEPSTGIVSLTGSIGSSPDGSYTDGLFTTFTSKTPIGTMVDKFNEVLKALAPPPAPDVDDIDGYGSSVGTAVYLTWDSAGNTANQGSLAMTPVASLAGLAATALGQQYTITTGSALPGSNRLGAWGTAPIDIYGNINADVSKNQQGSYENYPATSFGDGDSGYLELWINGTAVTFAAPVSDTKLYLDGSQGYGAVGTGDPGSGTGNYINADGSGFVSLSTTASGRTEANVEMAAFKHRTGRFKIAAGETLRKGTGSGGNGGGWNYVQVKHIIGAQVKVTNYVEWIDAPNTDALAETASSFSWSHAASETTLSGVKYFNGGGAGASISYTASVSNVFRNTFDATQVAFSATSQAGALSNAAVSGVTFSATNQPKGTPASNTAALGLNKATGAGITFSANYILGGELLINATVTHPFKTNLTTSTKTAGSILYYAVSDAATAIAETFQAESYRKVSGSFDTQGDITGNGTNWDSTQLLDSAAQYRGLQTYKEAIYTPTATLNGGNYSTLTRGPSGNANYSGLSSHLRTYYRKFQNTSGASVNGFMYSVSGTGTLVASTSVLGSSNNNFRLLFKLSGATSWLDAAQAFAWHDTTNRAGGTGTSIDTSLPIATNTITFGTASLASNEWIMMKVEADHTWTGNISALACTFTNSGGTGTAPADAPNPDGSNGLIQTSQDGTDSKLSFGSSNGVTGYTPVAASAGIGSAVDSNGSYITATAGNNYRIAVFNGATVIAGPVNGNVAAATGFTADAFGDAMLLTTQTVNRLEIYVNDIGTVKHTVSLASTLGSGNPGSGGGTDVNGNSTGFVSISVAAPATYANSPNVPDYNKMYRTANFQVGTADQRNGWNWVLIKHVITAGGTTTYTSNYIEWVNDPDSNALGESGAALANFAAGGGSTYTLSGVSYFTRPRGAYTVTVTNAYRNVYSLQTDAVTIAGANWDISTTDVTGTGITNSTGNADATIALPALDNSAACEEKDILITANVDLDSSLTKVLPGSVFGNASTTAVTVNATVKAPLKSNITTSTVSKSGFLVWSGNSSGTTNVGTSEAFKNETYRLVSGTYGAAGDVGTGQWNSATAMNGGGTQDDGLLIYNSFLISPQFSADAGFGGDFRNVADGGALQGPASNPNYSALTQASRSYYRYFTNAGSDAGSVAITIKGDATIVARNGGSNIGSNKNIYVDVAVPGSTGFLDAGRSTAGAGNITNGDGALVGDLDATVDGSGATNTASFNGQTIGAGSATSNFVIRIQASEDWTGYIDEITVSY